MSSDTPRTRELETQLTALWAFIENGCSARPEDKHHALQGLDAIKALFSETAAIVQVLPLPPQPETITTMTDSPPIAWGPEKQAYPGGPIYRIGTSTGVTLPTPPAGMEFPERNDHPLTTGELAWQRETVDKHNRDYLEEMADELDKRGDSLSTLAAKELKKLAVPSATDAPVGSIEELGERLLEWRARAMKAESALRSAIDAMPKQLTMSPEVVEIVERLSKLPPFAWPAWDARVLLGFCVLHAAHATVSAPTDGKGQP